VTTTLVDGATLNDILRSVLGTLAKQNPDEDSEQHIELFVDFVMSSFNQQAVLRAYAVEFLASGVLLPDDKRRH
jgi:hypothetical protein